MEIKGENFIKNVQIKQEKEELQAQIDQLDQSLEPASTSASSYTYHANQAENELDDIMLEDNSKSPANKSNKKKYIALGLALIILFLLTLVVFRLLSNQNVPNLVENKENIKQDKALNDDNIEQQYQKIINEKLKTINTQKTELEKKKSAKSLNLKEIEKEEKAVPVSKDANAIQKAEELKEDIFGIKNGKKVTLPKKEEPKVPVVKVTPKKEIDKILAKPKVQAPVSKVEKPVFKAPVVTPKKVVAPKVSNTTTSKPKGSFVQIGAFSKPISKEYLANITAKGLSYTLYKVEINSKMYTKVLIGPYRNKAHAQTTLPQIKKKLNISSAFILSF